jgi:AcrR family transcriptional regulator
MVYRKTSATAARKNARRKLILEAATRLFGSYGYHAATVPMIVAEASSSVGSFYTHFRNKEDVFAATLETLGKRVWEVMEEARISQADPLQGIRCAVESLFVYLAQNPQEARILIVESSGLSPRLEQVRRNLLRQHAGQVCQTLQSRAEAFSGVDPVVAARCLVGAVFESLYSWLEQSPAERPPAAKVASAVAEYNCRAIQR